MTQDILIGDSVIDESTGFSGVVIARTEYITGAVRVLVQPLRCHQALPVPPVEIEPAWLRLVARSALVRHADGRVGPPEDPAPATDGNVTDLLETRRKRPPFGPGAV